MFLKWAFCFVLMATPVLADAPLTADQIVAKVIARDKEVVQRRKAFDYDIDITREKLDENGKLVETIKDKTVVKGDHPPSYGTRSNTGNPEDEAKKAAKEEPFELLKIIDHYTYKLEPDDVVNGEPCYKIAFIPKPDMPYHNREEKVLNSVSGFIWASKKDFSLMRDQGSLQEPVSVAWIFATLKEMQFRYDSQLLPNGDYGPLQVQYRYLVSIPFSYLHERDTRKMSNFRLDTAAAANK